MIQYVLQIQKHQLQLKIFGKRKFAERGQEVLDSNVNKGIIKEEKTKTSTNGKAVKESPDKTEEDVSPESAGKS